MFPGLSQPSVRYICSCTHTHQSAFDECRYKEVEVDVKVGIRGFKFIAVNLQTLPHSCPWSLNHRSFLVLWPPCKWGQMSPEFYQPLKHPWSLRKIPVGLYFTTFPKPVPVLTGLTALFYFATQSLMPKKRSESHQSPYNGSWWASEVAGHLTFWRAGNKEGWRTHRVISPFRKHTWWEKSRKVSRLRK